MSVSSDRFAIRPYQPGDAPAMAQLYFEAARQVGSRRYTSEQVAAWAPAPVEAAEVHRRATDGRACWTAVDETGAVAGYIDLKPDGRIDHLYCRPDVAGKGVAGRMLATVLVAAAARGMPRLHVEASELARGLFARNGFVVVARRDFEVRGVAIHNYAMERGGVDDPVG